MSYDFNHCSDKGFGPRLLGSLFHDLVYNRELAPGRPIARQIEVLNELLVSFRQRHPDYVTAPYIYLKDFVDVSKPHSAFPYYNPGNMSRLRCTIPFGSELGHLFCTGDSYTDQRKWALFHASTLYDIVFRNGPGIGRDACSQLQQSCEAFLLHFNWLAQNAEGNNKLKWHVTMKNHYLWHICAEASSGISPRATMTYSGEDLVGAVADITEGTTKSVPLLKLGEKVLEKYLYGMSARMSR